MELHARWRSHPLRPRRGEESRAGSGRGDRQSARAGGQLQIDLRILRARGPRRRESTNDREPDQGGRHG